MELYAKLLLTLTLLGGVSYLLGNILEQKAIKLYKLFYWLVIVFSSLALIDSVIIIWLF